MKKQAKIWIAGVALSVMALTGVVVVNIDGNDSNANKPQTMATAPGTLAPSEMPVDHKDGIVGDLGINLDASMQSRLDPNLPKLFPDHDPREGARQLMTISLDMSRNENLQKARGANDPADSSILWGFEQDRMSGDFHETLGKSMDSGAYPFPATDRSGLIVIDGKPVVVDGKNYRANGKPWAITYGDPAIYAVADEGKTPRLVTASKREYRMPTAEGIVLKCIGTFYETGIPSTVNDAEVWTMTGAGSIDKPESGCEVINGSSTK